jgi:putative acetyltransferase
MKYQLVLQWPGSSLKDYDENMRHILIQAGDPFSPSARELIERLDKYLSDLYPAESNHLLSAEELQQPDVTFLTASVDGEVAGCGAFVNHGGEYAEIKRMFVLPEFRGIKLGRRILEEIENLARASGLELARLETGIYQSEALFLYKSAGYQPRGSFGDYPEDPLSIFMEKKL